MKSKSLRLIVLASILLTALSGWGIASDAPLKAGVAQGAQSLSKDLPTGSLLFSQGDCLAVKVFTASRYTHVGAVVVREGERFIFDSTAGKGVRQLPLAEYLASQGTATIAVYRPVAPFAERQQKDFEAHLESQLGRPYAIRHHLTGRRADGLHCAEFVTDALAAGEIFSVEQPPRVSPAHLREELVDRGLYAHAMTLQLEPEAVPQPESAGWCGRWWSGTRHCCRACYRKLSSWFCCK